MVEWEQGSQVCEIIIKKKKNCIEMQFSCSSKVSNLALGGIRDGAVLANDSRPVGVIIGSIPWVATSQLSRLMFRF